LTNIVYKDVELFHQLRILQPLQLRHHQAEPQRQHQAQPPPQPQPPPPPQPPPQPQPQPLPHPLPHQGVVIMLAVLDSVIAVKDAYATTVFACVRDIIGGI